MLNVSKAGYLQSLQVSDGSLLQTYDKYSTGPLVFSPDGGLLASKDWRQAQIRVWNVATGKSLSNIAAGAVYGMAFSPDGKTLASGSWLNDSKPFYKKVELWNIDTGQKNATLTDPTAYSGRFDYLKSVYILAFSPDGKTLAAGSRDGLLTVWQVSTGSLLNEYQSTQPIESLAFSPDGKLLATGSSNGLISLWDASTFQVVGSIQKHTSAVTNLAFSSDGMRLVSASSDLTVRVWGIPAH
jgi:WD40 repeat protein